ncbi:MAG: hypothetical protein HY692_02835 [Cyanobacteria bacterium NC_groundwater_1444_Ag_S-0.65um_54_12]|nr:hypothetical protein [Cyanobacteria bacterium NC_groundwater_1444_Ag_S-0.65um_54_12]
MARRYRTLVYSWSIGVLTAVSLAVACQNTDVTPEGVAGLVGAGKGKSPISAVIPATANPASVSSESPNLANSATPGSGATAAPSNTASSGSKAGQVQSVTLLPQQVTLNVPAAAAASSSWVLPTSQQFTAKVTFSDRLGGAVDVNWSSSDPNRVTMTSSGLASTLSTAATGTIEIRATAKTDPSKFATASLTVTRDVETLLEIK